MSWLSTTVCAGLPPTPESIHSYGAQRKYTLRDHPELPNPHSVTPPQKPPEDCGEARIAAIAETRQYLRMTDLSRMETNCSLLASKWLRTGEFRIITGEHQPA